MDVEIDISTHNLAEQTCKALGGKVTLEDVLTIWHSIGNVVKNQLTYKKGVRLSSFGTFTMTAKGEPVFLMSSDLGSQLKVKQRTQPASGNWPTAALNFSLVREGTSLPRETVEKIYSKMLACMGRAVFSSRNVLLSFHRVAEVVVAEGQLTCRFLPAFQDAFAPPGKKTPPPAPPSGAGAGRVDSSGFRMDQFGAEEGEARRARGGRPASAGRVRNPITGSGGARPASAGRTRPDEYRRPGSAGSVSSRTTSTSQMYSPRVPQSQPLARTAPAQRGDRGGSGGLCREQLERFNREQAPPAGRVSGRPDPRAVAAKALETGDIIDKVRKMIVKRGGSNGIRSVSKLLSIMDDNGDKRLSKDELKFGLRDYGIDLSAQELEQVFLYFDRDGNGFIDCTEFLVGLRGEMSLRRKKLIRMAFDLLDTDRSGVVTTDEIMGKYNFDHHPEVKSGKKTTKEAARDFMAQWDKSRDGLVSPEEFEDYYKDVSASIDDDDYFELMMRNAWRISGGTGASANTANKRVLVTNRDGTQSVATIENELGMRPGDRDEARRRLAQQGIDAADVGMHAGVDNRDAAPRRAGGRPMGNTGHGRTTGAPTRMQREGGGAGVGRAASLRARPSPREAWMDGPSGGDYGEAPAYEDEDRQEYARRPSPRQGGPGSGSGSQGGSQGVSGEFDALQVLRKMLYTPPIPMEPFCSKLAVSSASPCPRVAMGAFLKRVGTLDPALHRSQLKALWAAVDPAGAGVVEVASLHAMLASNFGADKTALRAAGVIERVVQKILERSGLNGGFKGLQRTLSIMDDNGDKRLSKDELGSGLRDYGIDLNIRELDEIFHHFDRDRNGVIDVNEFIIGIRGDMNQRRKGLVLLAFNVLDTDRSGYITVEEMMDIYDFSHHPEVKSGKKTKKEAMREFMGQWDDADGDGTVSYGEFEDYYKGLSASIDGDDYFELMMRNAWRISGGTGASANTANKRVLVTNRDGTQSVATIENELGMRPGDRDEARRRLAQQGIDAADVGMHAGVDNRDAAPRRAGGRPMGNTERRSMGTGSNAGNGGRSGGQAGQAVAGDGRQAFTRHTAAAKLAAAYRGRKGREAAGYEKKKLEALRRADEYDAQEAGRPRAMQVHRPKGNSYIGF